MHVVALVGTRQSVFSNRRIAQVVALDTRVRPHAHMLNPRQVAHVVELVHHVLHRHRLRRLHHEGNVGNAHHTALGRQLLDRLIRARPARRGNQRPTVPMRQNDGLLRDLQRIQLGLIAGVPHIHHHAHGVHAVDHFCAVLAHASVHRLKGAVRHLAPEVVAQLRNALPKPVALVDGVQVLKLVAALKTIQNPQLALLLGLHQVSRAVNPHHPLRIHRHEVVEPGKQIQRVSKIVCPVAEVDDGNARALELVEVGLGKGARHRQPLLPQFLLIKAVEELVEHIDHQRLAHQPDNALRILLVRLREHPVAVPQHKGRTQSHLRPVPQKLPPRSAPHASHLLWIGMPSILAHLPRPTAKDRGPPSEPTLFFVSRGSTVRAYLIRAAFRWQVVCIELSSSGAQCLHRKPADCLVYESIAQSQKTEEGPLPPPPHCSQIAGNRKVTSENHQKLRGFSGTVGIFRPRFLRNPVEW